MSQLVTAPYFDCACSGGVEPVVSNPIMFYSAALGTPASLGLIPPIPGLGAFAAEQTGNGPVYVWNPNSATWSYLANTVLFNPLMFYHSRNPDVAESCASDPKHWSTLRREERQWSDVRLEPQHPHLELT